MTMTIGIFHTEEKALEAIKLLRTVNGDDSGLRFVVKNQESAPILASQSDIPVEEVYEIRKAQERSGISGVAPIGVATPFASTGISETGVAGVGNGAGGIVVGGLQLEDESDHKKVMLNIGIPDSFAKECGEAVEAGRFLLITESDAENEATAEALLIQAGATDIYP